MICVPLQFRIGLLAIGALLVLVDPGARAADALRPNIVWIFVEDLNGWMGCYGDTTVPTPNIDTLATRGVRFTRAYMTSGVCSATRSAVTSRR